MQIDFTYLETVSDGDHDFIIQFVSTFENTSVSLTKKMNEELAANDIDSLGKTAHQLKPSAKMLGIASADQLENLQYHPEAATQEILNEIQKDCAEALVELKAWAKEKGVL